MPIVNRLQRVKTDQATELAEALFAEFRSPKNNGQPVIAIEPDAERPSRVTVIWDRWEGLDQRERSEIITDVVYRAANENVQVKDATHLTVALGLTRREAERMGFRVD